MKTVQGLFSHNITKLNQLSWLIRKLTGKPYSHFAWKIGDMVSESVWPISRKIPYLDWLKINEIIETDEIQMTDDHYVQFEKECEAELGHRYSMFQLCI